MCLQVSVNHGILATVYCVIVVRLAGDAEELQFRMVNCAQCTDMFPDARKHFSLDVQCERGIITDIF